MAMITVQLFSCLADGGMANAIIYKQTKDPIILSSIHWINVAIGTAIFLCVCFFAPVVALFFKSSTVEPVIAWLALGPFLISWGIVIQAVLRCELRFRALCFIKVTNAIVALIISVVMAYLGFGVFSMVYGYLAGMICELLMAASLALDYSWPRMIFRRSGLKDYVRFGGFQLGERFINFLGANSDYFIIGRVLGEDALGLYRIAYELVVMPISKINPVVTRVVLPGFAKLKDPERIRKAYLEIIQFLSGITLPFLLGLWAIAPLFFQTFIDPRYVAAVELVRILVLVGVFKTLCNPIGVAIVSLGRPDIGFYWNFILLLIYVPVFWTLAPLGLVAVAWGYVGITAVSFLILNGPILKKLMPGAGFVDVLKQIYLPVLISFAMAAIVVGAEWVAQPIAWPRVAMFLLIALGVVSYVGLMTALNRTYVQSFYSMFFKKRETT